ncbi:putative chitinase [Microsporum canis]
MWNTCGGASSSGRYVGYYGSWCVDRPCDALQPSNINAAAWTHLNYGFALIDQETFKIKAMHSRDSDFYKKFVNLKQKAHSVKTSLAVGGWDVGGKAFSDMARFPGSRKAFINSAVDLIKSYGFDGIDIDWEYPAADDRGGHTYDIKNYVTLLKELRAAIGPKALLTVAIPASYWYLRGFDLPGMAKYVDWFNFMSYDIHGVWDGDSPFTSRVIAPHTNLTEISSGLDLLWRNSISPSQVSLGLGFYGRSFTLANPSCTVPGCPFAGSGGGTGGGEPGSCTGVSGTLSNYEIERILHHLSPNRVYDEEAGVNWMSWKLNQWVSFDDTRSLRRKADFANQHCLGGLMAWSVDLGGPGTLGNPNSFDPQSTEIGGASLDGRGITDGGSGEVFISPDIYREPRPVINCYPPCTFILPPFILNNTVTISLPPWTTSLAVGWTTTSTTTLPGGSVSTSTGFTTVIQTTTLTIPPITTTAVDVWNYIITDTEIITPTVQLTRSIIPPPLTITNNPNPESKSGISHPPVTRTVTPPPYPHTTIIPGIHLPTVTVKPGPPGPLCKSGCGTKCHIFCNGLCWPSCSGKGSSGGDGFFDPNDPNRPRTPDPDNPDSPDDTKKDPCDPDFDSSSGLCPTGNFPIWDPSTRMVRCDVPNSMVNSQKSPCQKMIDDNFDENRQKLEAAKQCCPNGAGSSLFGRRADATCSTTPLTEYFETTPPDNGKCHATFTCDYAEWPNVCANARSAIEKRGKTSILTAGVRRNIEVTHPWYHGKFQSGEGLQRGSPLAGWQLKGNIYALLKASDSECSANTDIDCNVEEYPFSSGDPLKEPKLDVWEEQAVLRLVPKSENSAHALALRNFYFDSANAIGEKSYTGLKYCMEFANHPTGNSDEDFFLGDDTSKNICAEPYGNAFLLINGAKMRKGERRWDPWWDDKLFDHTIRPGIKTTNVPSQYCDHPSPGKKTHIGGVWTTVDDRGITVGEPLDRLPSASYSCDDYPGYIHSIKRSVRGRRSRKGSQVGGSPLSRISTTKNTNSTEVRDSKSGQFVESSKGALKANTSISLIPRAAGQGGFLSPDVYAFLGCTDLDDDDPCARDANCATDPDLGDVVDEPTPTITSPPVHTETSNCKICVSTEGQPTSSCSFQDNCAPTPVPPLLIPSCTIGHVPFALVFEIKEIGSWAADHGAALLKEMKGCGAVTEWKWAETSRGSTVTFNLPIVIKAGCVERAIVSAKGPELQCQEDTSDTTPLITVEGRPAPYIVTSTPRPSRV